jgi:hypothetical protein
MALTKTPATIISAATSNGAGSTTRGTIDLRSMYGGILTVKITNGGTGPAVQAVANVLIAHNSGSTPTAASAGTDWKTVASWGNGLTASVVGEWSMVVDPAVTHLEVEVTGNTSQAVTCEAFITQLAGL